MRGEEPVTQFGRMCSEVGDRDHRGQFAASEGTGGAGARDASGSLGEETAAEGDRQPRSRERVFAERVSGGTQPAICTCRGEEGETITGARRAQRNWTGFSGWRRERTMSEDWVVRYDNRFFQLEPQSQSYAPTQSKVVVCEGRYGGLGIEYRGRPLRWRGDRRAHESRRISIQRSARTRPRRPISVKKRKWTPPANHPWHQAVRREVQKRSLQVGRHRAAHDAGLALRFALNAQPCGLRRAALRARPAKQRDAVGRARWESSFLELPGANFFDEKHPGKKKRQNRKRGHFKRGKEGDISKEL